MRPMEFPLFWMLVFHALADYPLQGDYVAKFKSPWLSPNIRAEMAPGTIPPWWIVMSAHCLIHAGGVAIATGSVYAGAAEFIGHFYIDVLKCRKIIGFRTDQLLHVACKVFFAVWLYLGILRV